MKTNDLLTLLLRSALIELFSNGVHKITFIKTDGSEREMEVSLDQSLQEQPDLDLKYTPPNLKTLYVNEVIDGKVFSLKQFNLYSLLTVDGISVKDFLGNLYTTTKDLANKK